MRLRLLWFRERLATSLWTVPMVAAVLAILLARGLVRVDEHLSADRHGWYLYGGQAEGARALLSTIASSMLTFTGLVFSITILVLQLASAQFSSRVLNTFLEDRLARAAMGAFVGSFVYAMALLPEVRAETDTSPGFVPSLSVYVAFVLVLVSVGVFVGYIHHMAHSIRAIHVLRRVGDETRRSLDRMYPREGREEPPGEAPLPPGPPVTRFAHRRAAGVISAVDEGALMRLATERDLVIALLPAIGDFVPTGAPLFEVWGAGELAREELSEMVMFAPERTTTQDPGFGFRQLVDVAERALSPAVNDPTTAVQALDQLHDLLRSLADRRFPSARRRDDEGRLRLVLPRPDWDAYVHLALDEIRQFGGGSLQVHRRLRALLEDLLSFAPPERRPALEEQLALLSRADTRSFHAEEERRWARKGSAQGQGQPEE